MMDERNRVFNDGRIVKRRAKRQVHLETIGAAIGLGAGPIVIEYAREFSLKFG